MADEAPELPRYVTRELELEHGVVFADLPALLEMNEIAGYELCGVLNTGSRWLGLVYRRVG